MVYDEQAQLQLYNQKKFNALGHWIQGLVTDQIADHSQDFGGGCLDDTRLKNDNLICNKQDPRILPRPAVL